MAFARNATTAAITFVLSASLVPLLPSTALADAKSDLDAANEAASTASAAYDEAKARQDELANQIQAESDELADLVDNRLPAAQSSYNAAVRQMYREGSDFEQIVVAVFSGISLRDLFTLINGFENIAEWRSNAVSELCDAKFEIEQTRSQLESDKAAQDAAVEEAAAKKQEALDAQSAARAAYQATLPQNVPTTRRAPTATSFNDEASARAFIVMKESGGNYNARNGRYIGAYQLTNTYLNGDYSPENQDRVAEQYVRGRYGSWMAAANFWVSHGWY